METLQPLSNAQYQLSFSDLRQELLQTLAGLGRSVGTPFVVRPSASCDAQVP